MKFSLIKQLLVVSICTLILPWTGCQYVQEMETLIRQQQSNTLSAFTKPLAENIKGQPLFQEKAAIANNADPFFAPFSHAPIILDGYDNEWVTYTEHNLASNPKNPISASLKTKLNNSELFLFLTVNDDDIQYYDPTQTTLTSHDWIKIITPKKSFYILTSAPGNVHVFFNTPTDKQLILSQHLKGSWQEQDNGYQVELSIPLSVADQGIRIEVKNFTNGKIYTGAASATSGTPPLLSPSPKLTEWIKPFQSTHWDLQIINEHGWPLLSYQPKPDDITLPLVTRENLGKLLLNRIYRFFLDATLPTKYAQQWPLGSTKLSTSNNRIELDRFTKFNNSPFKQWYTLNESNQSILVVIQPIIDSEKTLGYVIATQKENALLSFTNTALRRVMNLSLLAFIAVVSILLGYAIWLSLRIKHLKQNAEASIDQDGSITPFSPSHAPDEIGDLSQSYAQLLNRVKNYNDYLQSLTHKLAHEIRTPLAIVKSSLEMLQVTPKEKQQDYIERALQGNQRLGNILNSMSESTQVEQLVQNTEFCDIALDTLLKELAQAYQQAYPNYQFVFEHDESIATLKPGIKGNPELLAQMIDKLVDNARDFTQNSDPIRLSIATDRNHVFVKVINLGPSLPDEMAAQLFDSLISVRDKDNKPGTHLGLGLYIVRLIANAHQGSVRAYNLTDSTGVCFEIQLPRAE